MFEIPKCDLRGCACRRVTFLHRIPLLGIVWIETPKCGSMTLKRVLKPRRKILRDNFSAIAKQNFTFAVVRNPYDRLVSNWRMFRTFRKHVLPRLPDSFDHFVREFSQQVANHHWAPLCDFFPRREDGKVDLTRIDMICRLEHLEQDLTWLTDQLPDGITLAKSNTTDHRPYQEYYTPKLRKFVGEMYAEDFETFKYTF